MDRTRAERFSIRFVDSILDIDPPAWNALAGSAYPFLRHEFLRALEESGCASRASGWEPHHAIVHDSRDGQPAALAPLYLKSHSFGEYVFDWSWADAYRQHGLRYYPKLVCAVPFTPSAGPRICIPSGEAREETLAWLASRLREEVRARDASSLHVLFPEPDLSEALQRHGLERRAGCQYQWFNEDFEDFEAFLGTFSSRKRKNLRKERQSVAETGIRFQCLEGQEIDASLWRVFHRFYQSTYFVRGRQPYLNEDFFLRVGELMPEAILLVLAFKDGEAIAGALSFKGADTLYGRYWGCSEEYAFLHFETCYYQGIDYCIRNRIRRFDSGAQGEHKIQRGFSPVRTWSNHWLAHPQFGQAIARFLREEEEYVGEYIERAAQYLPFRREDG